ncbi:hypothetical protein [Humibacter antri]
MAGAPDHYRLDAPDALVTTAREFVAGARWVYASTMPSAPHHYTLRKDAAAGHREAGYDALLSLILHHHYLREWRGRSFRGVTLGGLTMWIMQTGLVLVNAKPAEPDDWAAPGLFDFL